MQVYDLDKTQEWLNRTLTVRREPPLRGGVRTDLKTRRQTLAGVGVVALVLLLLACASVRQAVVASAKPVAVPATMPGLIQPQPVNQAPSTESRRSTLTERWLASLHQPDNRPILDVMPQAFFSSPGVIHSDGRVAPPAPVWLDGKQ